jgi:hypothetical protein
VRGVFRFCFELFDFNINSSLSREELCFMMHTAYSGVLCLAGKRGIDDGPLLALTQELAEEAFAVADVNRSNTISLDEFTKVGGRAGQGRARQGRGTGQSRGRWAVGGGRWAVGE